ncbi:hypothetical protein K443DRAFT_11418 [Laccaria amethystina LaAM-08-1]|uniref:cystathionine gamma-lyase n=1 Tax=Laccaria amethystina LaAM-08-1 TaxID=1095629 RepID=A0A0C9XGX1_9AGAR|nr:hypothetical protein K443DRAFT_11418 [Laccaria amethystina LaAM-08-1]
MSAAVFRSDPISLNGAKAKAIEDGFGTRAIHVDSEGDGCHYAAHILIYNLQAGSGRCSQVLQSLEPNSHMNDVYGGTFRYMTKVANENQGLETAFVDLEHADGDIVRDAIRENTKRQLITHKPYCSLINIPRLAQIAHSHTSHPLLLVDNTFLSPFYSSPLLLLLLLRADIVMRRFTKYINGHSDTTMGALILPPPPFLSAYDSWLAQRGAKTLNLRVKVHGQNALMVARTLKPSSHVGVVCPGLEGDKRTALA